MQIFIDTIIRDKKQRQVKLIDWNDSNDRKWLVNHQHWAMNNGHKISMQPANNYHRTIHRIASEGNFGDTIIVRESN